MIELRRSRPIWNTRTIISLVIEYFIVMTVTLIVCLLLNNHVKLAILESQVKPVPSMKSDLEMMNADNRELVYQLWKLNNEIEELKHALGSSKPANEE